MISFKDIGFTWLYFTAEEKTRLKKYCLFLLLAFLLSLLFSFADVRYFYRCLPFECCWNGASFQRSFMWVFPPRSWKRYSVSKQSWVKCSLHTYTYLGSGRPNLLPQRIWSSHCLASSGFFTGKLWKLTPLTISFSDLLLQPGTRTRWHFFFAT